MTIDELLAHHRTAGRTVEVAGLETFLLDEGSGEAVVLVHGVPTSSFVWRKVVAGLAERGLRAIAPDLPGLGLSARPTDLDYSWGGLGAHLASTIDELGLERFHLVVHDIGGPVGFEAAHRLDGRVASLTILNTIVAASSFSKPWPMRPFDVPVVNRLWLESSRGPVYRSLFRHIALNPDSDVTDAEVDVHRRLLTRHDRGRAFLRIMRSFDTTAAAEARYRAVVGDDRYPRQVVWGGQDRALRLERHGRIAAEAAGVGEPDVLAARHFLMEDVPGPIVDRVARLIERAGG